MTRERLLPLLFAFALAASVAALYWPAAGYDYVVYDDDRFVRDNPAVQQGLSADGTRLAFTGMANALFVPLTWLSLAADVTLWGDSPGAFHRSNLLLFALCAGLLLLVLARATGALWPSAFAAALFALHPLRVESVAWIVERKDVLCLLFLLAALAAWLRHARTRSRSAWLLALALFACSLMSKPVAVTFPLLLLILDLWPLGRIGGRKEGPASGPGWAALVAEKLPFFALSLAAALFTLVTHPGAGMGWKTVAGVLSRLQLALLSPFVYLRKTVWPDDLAVRHLLDAPPARWWVILAAAAALALLTALALRARRRRPWLLAGWLWYLAALLPVGGLFQTGQVAIADRFTLLPHLGLMAALAWEGAMRWPGEGQEGPGARFAAGFLAALLLVSLTAASRAQLGYWRDTGTLMGRALAFSPGEALFHNNLGVFLGDKGDLEGAMEQARIAVLAEPGNAMYDYNYAYRLIKSGRGKEALPFLREAVRLAPGDPVYRLKLAELLLGSRLEEEALLELERWSGSGPPADLVPVGKRFMARALARLGRRDEAIARYEELLALDPGNFGARLELADLLLAVNRRDEAVANWQEVADTVPEETAESFFALGRLRGLLGRKQEEAGLYLRAKEAEPLEPGFAEFMKGTAGTSGR